MLKLSRLKKPKKNEKGVQRLLTVRAYCSKCGKLLMESNPMTKRELLVNWDQCVLNAPLIPCNSCGHSVPNLNLDLRIYHSVYNREWLPSQILPNPKDPIDVEKLANSTTMNDLLEAVKSPN